MNTEQYIRKLFTDAGWYEGRKFSVKNKVQDSSIAACKSATLVVSEFGGLNVGSVGAGRENSASDIAFRSEVFDFCSEFHNYWLDLNTSLYAFASAHNDHMLLLVDDYNEYYIFTDPDEELYKIGSFEDTISRVLLGINYGVALEKA